MFWAILLIGGMGYMLTSFGAYSVWVKVLALAVAILGSLFTLLMAYFIWDKKKIKIK